MAIINWLWWFSPSTITGRKYSVYDVSSYLDEHPRGDDVLLKVTGKDATEEFEDAGHNKDARELIDKFFIGEVDEASPPIPELKIVSKKQELKGLSSKALDLSKEYWFVPLTVIGLSMVVVGYLQLRKH